MCIILHSFSVGAQSAVQSFLTPSDSLHIPRRNAVVIAEASIGGLTLIGLNTLWYSDYKRSKFHTINDNQEWFQLDKLGHAFSGYQLGRLGAETLKWSGVREKNRLLYGGTLGFSFLTAVEILDSFSEEWGFSWGDFTANTAGAGLFIGQELLWDEQRIALKYSFHQTKYAALNPTKLGHGLTEEFLKDYNGQTYWLSLNLYSFFKESTLPEWLNLAVGYGADGMLAGTNNVQDLKGFHQKRYAQYYLSLDLDLTKIKTNSALLRTLFSVFNSVKVPLPTLEFTSENGLKCYPFFF
ncbi:MULTISPECIES: DUF2279 domain-containing protein [Bizionia]|uniref:DUF2279 domain-containing protein n=1 Tax=Bizionia TaxID=283785 RepID=UPI0029390888|nr:MULTISPECIES: DUF2279 domain-containing protein [Bizionia]